MHTQQQNPDGSWSPATPLGPQGFLGKLEAFLFKVHLNRLAKMIGRLDERGLGR